MRYTLMPTLLAAAARATADGMPIVRRLDLVWPKEDQTQAMRNDQYLLGDDLLVAPLISGTSRDVWFPPGGWEDAFTGKIYTGPKVLQVSKSVEQMPLFHRQGGLLVTAAGGARTVSTQNWSSLVLEAFPAPGCSRAERAVLREGEGTSGATTTVAMECREHSAGFVVMLHIAPGSDAPARRWLLRLHLRPTQRARRVSLDGSALLAGEVGGASPARATFWHIAPSKGGEESFFPLGGEGTVPASLAGPVVEFAVEAEDSAMMRSGGTGQRVVEVLIDDAVNELIV